MLESTAYSIAPSLNKLFNLSLTTGILPLALKKSSVVPIPKNQKLSDPYNQWGSLEGRSTVTVLLHLTDQWLQALEVGHDVCAVSFDFQKTLCLTCP